MQLKTKLEENGATEFAPPSTGSKADARGLTHIISTTIDFEGYDNAKDRMVSVVKPSWVTISLQKGRLANPRAHSPDPRLFFSGLVVCTADLPEGDKDAIIGGVLAMGGLFALQLSKMVTHIVALNDEAQACQVAIHRKIACKRVLPHW